MEDFFAAFAYLFTLRPFCLMAIGTSAGIIVGAVPGLTGAMLIALTIPMTFAMNSADAFVLLVSMYVGSISGGMITATLLRMPGTPASIMTTLDGYPMAQQGKPGRALGLGVSASFIGGLISWVFLVTLAGPMARFSVLLGPYDFFSLVMVALVLIASVSGRSLLLGLFSGLLGVFVSMPGLSPSTGELRLTFGFSELNDGFKLLPVLIGLFAVGQIFYDLFRGGGTTHVIAASFHGFFLTLRDWLKQAVNMIRSSVIGTWIGILPGIGANIASVIAYTTTRTFSKTPEKFGHGSEEGIVASEAANNATVGGALIPLISLGIPGSVIDAILLGALILHGLQPGPLLFENDPQIVYTMMATMFIANVFMFVFMVIAIRWLRYLLTIPREYLTPALMVFCVVGSYALSSRMFDVWVMLAFGVIGFLMERGGVPLAPFCIGFVLAPIAEENLTTGLMLYDGSYWPLVTRPISLTFLLVSAVLLFWPLRRVLKPEQASVGN